MTTRRTIITLILIALFLVAAILVGLLDRKAQRARLPRPLVSASPQPSPTPLPLVSTPPSSKASPTPPITQKRRVVAAVSEPSPLPTIDPSIAYNAARLARGLTSRIYFGGEQGPSGTIPTGTMLIVHPDGSREQFACMKRVACEGCKVLVTKLVADVTCGEDRERYK